MAHFVEASLQNASIVLKEFLYRHQIDASLPPQQLLQCVATAFAQLPYENLSKIIRAHHSSDPEQIRRLPGEVLTDYYTLGAGGTCFSLTWTLQHLLKAMGFTAEFILADRRYGPNTHSALLVWLDGIPHLLDPGYLLVHPVPVIKQGSLLIPTSFQKVHLKPVDRHNQLQLVTEYDNKKTYRLTYKTNPVDISQFLNAWDESFQFDMMQYPVLSRIVHGQQYYLQKKRLMIRGKEGTTHLELTAANMPGMIQRYFDINPLLANQALEQLRKRGS